MSPRPALADSRFHDLPGGGRMRYALYEPQSPPRGTMLIAPGRREFIEKKFFELGTPGLERGLRLIIFEWRGQGLSDRYLKGALHQRDHIMDFHQHIADVDSFYEHVVRHGVAGPLILCGHSMGAHLLLRWRIERPDLPAAGLLLTGPMLALSGSFAHAVSSVISWGLEKLGHSEDYAPLQHDYGEHDTAFANNPLTHDPLRFKIIEDYFTAYPDMIVGGVSWGWLHAALRSMYVTQRRRNLERLNLPVLAIAGSEDRVTPPREISRYLHLIPGAENVIVSGGSHDILNETELLRAEAWRHIDAFLAKVMRG